MWQKGFRFVAGLDEAGRGPLAGPVVAAAVIIKNYDLKIFNKDFKGINDSKKLSEKQREYFYKILTKNKNIKWGIGIVSEKVIDKINILEATKLAMLKAIVSLRGARGPLWGRRGNLEYVHKPLDCFAAARNDESMFLLVDGNFSLKIGLPEKSVVKGDQKVVSISAASIIAKVTRDRIMEKYDKKYPQYGFKRHKGYPTLAHRNTLKKIGPCPIHRKTFFPVSTLHKA